MENYQNWSSHFSKNVIEILILKFIVKKKQQMTFFLSIYRGIHAIFYLNFISNLQRKIKTKNSIIFLENVFGHFREYINNISMGPSLINYH